MSNSLPIVGLSTISAKMKHSFTAVALSPAVVSLYDFTLYAGAVQLFLNKIFFWIRIKKYQGRGIHNILKVFIMKSSSLFPGTRVHLEIPNTRVVIQVPESNKKKGLIGFLVFFFYWLLNLLWLALFKIRCLIQ